MDFLSAVKDRDELLSVSLKLQATQQILQQRFQLKKFSLDLEHRHRQNLQEGNIEEVLEVLVRARLHFQHLHAILLESVDKA